MRKMLDCAVLLPPGQGKWLQDWLCREGINLRQCRIHVVELGSPVGSAGERADPHSTARGAAAAYPLASRLAACVPIATLQDAGAGPDLSASYRAHIAAPPTAADRAWDSVSTRGAGQPALAGARAGMASQARQASVPAAGSMPPPDPAGAPPGPLARALMPWTHTASPAGMSRVVRSALTFSGVADASTAPDTPASSGGDSNRHPLFCDGLASSDMQAQVSSVGAIAAKALYLRRFDLCLLPVSAQALGWTRLALLNSRDQLRTPVLGVVQDMKAPAIRDLLDLGMSDFIRWPVCAEELVARMVTMSSRERSGLGRTAQVVMGADKVEAPDDGAVGFREAKAGIVRQFERQYLTRAMQCHGGNVSQAARASGKHRRAFWALLRKHRIDASPFRKGRDAMPGWSKPAAVDDDDGHE